jgi:hypothetical protein
MGKSKWNKIEKMNCEINQVIRLKKGSLVGKKSYIKIFNGLLQLGIKAQENTSVRREELRSESV